MLIKEDVAKRIAQSTNSDDATAAGPADGTTVTTPSQTVSYKVGDHVRCTFSEDGVDYEAEILSLKGELCWVRYVGYNNEESVDISALIPSWGPAVRDAQMRAAGSEPPADTTATPSSSELVSGAPTTTATTSAGASTSAAPVAKNKKHTNAGAAANKNRLQKSFDRVRSGMMIPPPPPLPPMFGGGADDADDGDSEHLSSMLMAWYMSGYYTGLYQAQKMAKQQSQQQE